MIYKYLFFVLVFLTSSQIISQEDFFEPSTTVGGYGELHFNRATKNDNSTNKLDFHRFVLFYGHQWTEKWSFKSEVELEHNFVSGDNGELELEQAYIDYHHATWFGFQAGVILPSIGLLNEYHEPPLFFGVERPTYAKYIVPTTWFGNGIAFYGQHSNFDYRLTIMEGLNAEKISQGKGIRSARIKGFKPKADQFLYNLRLNYLGINGLKVGTSLSFTNAMGDSINNSVTLIEVHIKYVYNQLHLVGEFGNIGYGEGELKSSRGYYVDLGYNFGKLLKTTTKVIPFIRYTNYNTAASTLQGGDSEKKYNKTKWMLGFVVLPISEVVFKFDYSELEVELSKIKTKHLNFGVGYMF
ncbi:MAG: hypothetical protein V3V16_12090 [Melioribacteraceae bacterium]